MDFKKLINRYKLFGGVRLVLEYAKLGVLGVVVKGFFTCLVKGQSFKAIYPEVLKRVEPMLVAKYRHVVQRFKSSRCLSNEKHNENENNASTGSATVWFCWLQGLDDAPEIVKACYNSIKRNIPDREIKVIDAKNWKEYVELPEFIVEKWEKGRIPAALFSDLLRLELLIKYGGTWIDSTVLCTGVNDNHNDNENYLNADLFLYQYSRPGSKEISISNWFITARKNNEILVVLREMLYAYWKDYDCTLDYYMFHLFFSMIAKEYPEEIAKMPYGSSQNSIALMYNWAKPFNQDRWDRQVSRVSFHKLSHRVPEEVKRDKKNYYSTIIKMYG